MLLRGESSNPRLPVASAQQFVRGGIEESTQYGGAKIPRLPLVARDDRRGAAGGRLPPLHHKCLCGVVGAVIDRPRATKRRPYEVGGGAVGEERRKNRNRIRSVRYSKLSVYCPHSSSVKNQSFLPPSPGGKA